MVLASVFCVTCHTFSNDTLLVPIVVEELTISQVCADESLMDCWVPCEILIIFGQLCSQNREL